MYPRYSRYFTFIRPILDSKVTRNYSFVVFSIFTSIIFAVFAIQPTIKTIISLQKSINEQQALLKKLEEKSVNIDKGKKNYDNLDQSSKNLLLTIVPNSTQLPNMIEDLSNLAANFEATISGLQFQPSDLTGSSKILSKEASVTNLDFTLNFQGQFKQLINVLDTLKRFDRLISINSVNFNKSTEGALLMSINAKLYYLKDKN